MNHKSQIETNVVKPKMFFKENEQEYNLMDALDEASLDAQITKIRDYVKNNDGRFQPEEYKDKLYAESKKHWEDYANFLRNVKFSLYLNKDQFEYLTDLLVDQMEYDINTIFFAIELTNMLGNWSESETADNDTNLKCYHGNATEITYLYHLISKHKVKGLTNESYRFSEVLRRLDGLSRIINYYDTGAKTMAKEIQDWVADFDPQQLTGTSLSPQY
jgi:hypothetical protein